MDSDEELFLTQNGELSIITQTTVRQLCFVQLYDEYLSTCPESAVAKDLGPSILMMVSFRKIANYVR